MEAPSNHRLLVFVPEGDRESKTIPVDLQDRWVVRLLGPAGRLFRGGTAYGRGVGVWQDDRRRLHWDRVTVVECWIRVETPRLSNKMDQLGRLLGRMCEALRQEVVGCMFDGRWIHYSRRRRP